VISPSTCATVFAGCSACACAGPPFGDDAACAAPPPPGAFGDAANPASASRSAASPSNGASVGRAAPALLVRFPPGAVFEDFGVRLS
jgi:hypothetical protein